MAVKKSGTSSRKSSGSSSSSASKGSKGSSSSTASSSKAGVTLAGVLDKVGADSVVDVWRDRVSGPVGKQIEKIDVSEALEKAREYASMSGAAIKKAGGKNPKMFYSGIAAILVGAGLMASARSAKAKSGSSSGKTSKSSGSKASSKSGGSKKSSRSSKKSSGKSSSGSGSSGSE